MDMTATKRSRTMAELRRTLLRLTPHPSTMYAAIERELPALEDFIDSDVISDCYAGMTADDVKTAASDSLFSLGAHTLDHPYLTLCDSDERRRQIAGCKHWLEALTSARCEAIAYPGGDYDEAVVKECVDAEIVRGYAIDPRLNTRPRWEVPRLGIYSSDLERLSIKVRWGNLLRDLRVNVG
jgi:peptidoglycan/xylan/chitin deacetylase (PgdA/CDA1 family)